ncbi:MAG: hypothetical protein V1887_02175 [Candidatus Aenigmatarchaeota archaeon]
MTNMKLPLTKPVFEPFFGLVRPKQPLFNIGGTDYRQITPKRPMVIRKGYSVKSCFYYRGTKTCMGVQCYWPKVGTCSLYDRLYANTKGGRIAAIKTDRIKLIRAKRARMKGRPAKPWGKS